jgi:hypothetical protein
MWLFLKRHVPKKYLYIGIVLLVAGGIIFAYWIYNSAKEKIDSVSGENIVCPMNGTKTTKEKAGQRPFAVMIENSVAARPQAGLDKTDLIYETIAEGGITRMMAVYACGGDKATSIGPVRSARPYFVDWVEGIKAIYAHAGGSPQALDQIQDDGVLDINNHGDGKNFWRVSYRTSPHNLYTSYEGLVALAKQNNYDLKATYKELNFKDDASLDQRPESQTVVVNFSSTTYQVKWIYDKKSNTYLRYLAGAVDKDAVSGRQLTAKTIIVMRVKQKESGAANKYRLEMETVGSGEAIIFQDGKAIIGTWEKKFKEDRETFYDESGNEIELTAGRLWLEIVKPETKIAY